MLEKHRSSALACALALACAAPTSSAESDGRNADNLETLSNALEVEAYVDARSFFTEDADINGWYALTLALKDDFDDICGDTFCEGDYSNYESLGFRCSVGQAAGNVAQCVWVFAASVEDIDPVTGTFDVHGELWQCPMPLAPQTPAAQLLAALAAPDQRPLFAALPGSTHALYEGLIDCL